MQNNHTEPLTNLIIEGIQNRKGRGISIVDLSGINASGVIRFIICEGTSPTQVGSIADSVREHLLTTSHIKPYGYDGYRNSQWIVLDYGDTLVHIFLPDTRKIYDLEELWSDANITTVPDLD